MALVADHGREEEQLQLGQLFADAPPLPQGEDEHFASEVLVQRSVGIQESVGVKGLWMGPVSRVVIDGPLVDEDDRVLWDAVAHDGRVRGGGMGNGERHEARVSHHLVDESHDIRQLQLVLDGGEPASIHHFVHLLLETCLHLRIPALTDETSCCNSCCHSVK